MDQVVEHDLPPDWAKLTDSRAPAYIDRYGEKSWELDAIPPEVLVPWVEEKILEFRDPEPYQKVKDREDRERAEIKTMSAAYKDGVTVRSIRDTLQRMMDDDKQLNGWAWIHDSLEAYIDRMTEYLPEDGD